MGCRGWDPAGTSQSAGTCPGCRQLKLPLSGRAGYCRWVLLSAPVDLRHCAAVQEVLQGPPVHVPGGQVCNSGSSSRQGVASAVRLRRHRARQIIYAPAQRYSAMYCMV